MFTVEKERNVQRVIIDEECGAKYRNGDYITLFCSGVDGDDETTKSLTQIITEMLTKLHCNKRTSKILVAGLGNNRITPDALGVRAAERVLATAHFTEISSFDELSLRRVYVVTPKVMAQTGFETLEQLSFITSGIKPDCVIVVDSLACDSLDRLIKTVQITNTGINPGSGVENQRREISQETLGCPVIAIGVPMVVNMADSGEEPIMLVPRDIDIAISRFSRVISNAINKALNPELSCEDIESLITY